MLDLLTADDVLSHVMMLAATNEVLYILVEGSSDCSVLDPHLSADVCETLPSGGKSVVLEAVALAREEGFKRLAAAVDLDWADILYPRLGHDNIFYTDHYDIDATVFFREHNILRVAANFADRSLLRRHISKSDYHTLHDMVTRVAFPIGVLRYISERDRLELYLRDFPVSVALNAAGNGIDFDKLIDLAMKRSPRSGISRDELVRLYRETEPEIDEPRRYCSGHDLLAALAVILYRHCGSKASADAIARATRASFACTDAKESLLFQAMNTWGSLHDKEILSCL
ncbi:hypothetical protein [Streptomyces sp. 900105245]